MAGGLVPAAGVGASDGWAKEEEAEDAIPRAAMGANWAARGSARSAEVERIILRTRQERERWRERRESGE